MPKVSSIFVCQQCGYQSPTYLGRCPECQSWNSFVEQISQISISHSKSTKLKELKNAEVIQLKDLNQDHYDRLSSSILEFDRVLGGGIVRGSLVLLAGDPGIGKSTLLSQLAINLAAPGATEQRGPVTSIKAGPADSQPHSTSSDALRGLNGTPRSSSPATSVLISKQVLYIAGEESAQQIKLRIDRIKKGASFAILNEVDVDIITGVIEQLKPALVIVDSIQTLKTSDLESAPGSVGQVRESAQRLQTIAKKLHIPIFLVGHVTKEGTVAGPKTLEHLVDVVLSLEGEETSQFRVLRANKNRFGPTDEVGIFEMDETGMVEVKNPSKIFLEQKVNAPGSAVVAILTGLRPILLEIQALVTKTNLAFPRRVGNGIDNNRLQLLVAVLSKRLNLNLFDKDVFINVTGGMKIFEPAVDLAICMAIVSSFKDKAINPKLVFIGEVGLLGELRAVRQMSKRTQEAKALGFSKVISSDNAKSLTEALRLSLS
ncbi:DNA repair protein RadA [Candidatus Daviesbacteria bacterium]|nr:DNA repair protein RadA [Candidatus Daviesbacteria bacterium]